MIKWSFSQNVFSTSFFLSSKKTLLRVWEMTDISGGSYFKPFYYYYLKTLRYLTVFALVNHFLSWCTSCCVSILFCVDSRKSLCRASIYFLPKTPGRHQINVFNKPERIFISVLWQLNLSYFFFFLVALWLIIEFMSGWITLQRV